MLRFFSLRLTSATLLALIGLFSGSLWAIDEAMPNMPKIQPKKVFTVPNAAVSDELVEQSGFGDEAPMVNMMNLMMVGGSGYEGMDMDEMKVAGNTQVPANPHAGHGAPAAPSAAPSDQTQSYDIDLKPVKTPIRVGANMFEIEVRSKQSGKPPKGLAPSIEVYMTNMDMGTEKPKARLVAPGRFQVKAIFSMQGPWAIKVSLPDGAQKEFPIQAASK